MRVQYGLAFLLLAINIHDNYRQSSKTTRDVAKIRYLKTSICLILDLLNIISNDK